MPLIIQRTATVYRLWDNEDVQIMFEDHAAADWLCQMNCGKESGAVVWRVALQHTEARQVVSALRDQVIVSDLVTVIAQSVDDYNEANPDNPIEVGS